MYDLLIIGGGAAGLGAALYAARFKLNTAVIAKELGGTGNIAHLVDNWIGDPGIAGWDLMQKFLKHLEEYKVPMIQGAVTSVSKTGDGFSVTMESGEVYTSKMILFANGMVHKKLGVTGEDQYAGKGVHYCYTCDGPLYRNKVLAVIGGGDSAALGSLFLSQYGTKVYTIVRGEKMRAEPISAEKLDTHKSIEVVLKSNVAEVVGDGKKVTQLKLDTGRVIDLDGMFVEIGHLPLSDLAKGIGVELDSHGFISVNRKQETNVSGALAAGDITNATTLKQFITSAAEGSIAAQTAYHTLQNMKAPVGAAR